MGQRGWRQRGILLTTHVVCMHIASLSFSLLMSKSFFQAACESQLHISTHLVPSLHEPSRINFHPSPPSVPPSSSHALVYSSVIGEHMVRGDNAEGFIDGSEAQYRTSALDLSDCHFCAAFQREAAREDDRLMLKTLSYSGEEAAQA